MKQYSRFMAFILATAVTLAVSVGVMAYDDHLSQTLEGYGHPIPLDLSSLSLATSYSGNLVFSGAKPAGVDGSYSSLGSSTSVITPIFTSTNSFTVSITGAINYVDFTASSGVSSTGPSGNVHLTGSLGHYWYFGSPVYIPFSYNSSYGAYNFRYWSSTTSSIYPTSLSILFDDVEVVSIPNPSSSSVDISFDVMVPVQGSVSKVVFRLNYNKSISFSKQYSAGSVGSAYANAGVRAIWASSSSPSEGTSGYLRHYDSSRNSVSFEYIEDSSDYTSILERILSAIQAIGDSQSSDPMHQFENNYLENFGDQIDKTEQAMSPSNPALPNGGDIAGFADDISSGLGLSGSSFSASDFSEATSAFSGVESTGAGGPWEFFTQGVADDLSGDAPMSIDDDYDPILAWFEEAERRYAQWWGSSSP